MLALKGSVSAAAELADRAEGRPRPTITVAHQEIGAGLIVRNWKNFDRDGRPRTAPQSAAYVYLLTPDGGRRQPPIPKNCCTSVEMIGNTTRRTSRHRWTLPQSTSCGPRKTREQESDPEHSGFTATYGWTWSGYVKSGNVPFLSIPHQPLKTLRNSSRYGASGVHKRQILPGQRLKPISLSHNPLPAGLLRFRGMSSGLPVIRHQTGNKS
jgi:hypothetical protein